LARAFPGQSPTRRIVELTPDQAAQVEKAARSKLPSPRITVYEVVADGQLQGRAYLDQHVVRTLPGTLLTVVGADGRVRRVLLFVFWVSGWAMYFQRMGLHPASVVDYYNGNEAEFRSPQSLGSMTETLHIHMAMMSVVLLLLTHLAIFIPFPSRLKVVLIGATF